MFEIPTSSCATWQTEAENHCRPLSSTNRLKPPADFEVIWDWGARNHWDVAVWRTVCIVVVCGGPAAGSAKTG
jgi:hypothetical protein